MSESSVMLIGPGSIGGIVSWALSKAGMNVILKVKNDEQRRHLLDNGLLIEFFGEKKEKFHDFRVVTSWDELEVIPKWVFVTLKIPDLLKEIKILGKHVSPSNRVVYFQNGVLEDYLPKAFFSRGMRSGRVICWWSARMVDFGRISYVWDGETHVGPYNGDEFSEDDQNELMEMLQFVSTSIRWFNDIKTSELAKTIFNAALNGLTYLTGLQLGDLLSTEEGRVAFEGIISEGVMLSEKLGIALPKIKRMSLSDFSPNRRGIIPSLKKKVYLKAVRRIGKNMISSARISYLRGRSSEIPWLNGYIVRKGKELGLETPWNDKIMEYHDQIESRRLEPSPNRLAELHDAVLAVKE